jgi:hypothetical protein
MRLMGQKSGLAMPTKESWVIIFNDPSFDTGWTELEVVYRLTEFSVLVDLPGFTSRACGWPGWLALDDLVWTEFSCRLSGTVL